MPYNKRRVNSKVHRTLRVKTPFMKGADVKSLQNQINVRLRARDIDYSVKVDGEYGPKTHKGALKALYFLGVLRATCHMTPRSKRFTKKAQKYVRINIKRNESQIKRGQKRVKKANSGPTAAVKWALSKKGITESPPGSNKGPQISAWQRHWLGYDGFPWCGAFSGYALEQGGVKGLVGKNIVYTPAIVNDARAGRNGFVKLVSIDAAQKGDLVLFNWDGGVVDHVGVFTGRRFANGDVETVEGNTSSDNSGDQSNGGGVFVRRRPRAVIQYVARPRW